MSHQPKIRIPLSGLLTSRRYLRPGLLPFILAVGLIAAIACSSSDDEPTPVPQPTPTLETSAPASTAEPTAPAVLTGTGLSYGEPDYDFAAASFNSYWYSRYTLGNLAMMSGLGVTFEPPMEAVMGMVGAVDKGPEVGEHVAMPANAALLRGVYAGGDPEFLSAFNGDPMDLSNFRWDPEKMDTRLLPAAQAQTIIKETEWARFFNNPGWAGTVTDDFGAMDRFKGMVMYAEASQQTLFAINELRNDDGLFPAVSRWVDGAVTVEDPTVLIADQYQMLQAISDLRHLLQNADKYNNVYGNPDLLAMVGGAADELLNAVSELETTDIRDLGHGAQAMAWYAASAEDPALQRLAVDNLAKYGDALIAADTVGVIDSARAVRGLLEAARVIKDEKYRTAALNELDAVLSSYDRGTGRIAGITEIHDSELGDILGALNSAANNGGAEVDTAEVQGVYAGIFEAIVSIGGLMQSRIPVAMEVSPFELERIGDDIFFAHPAVPTPGEAGGEHGTAAVHASKFAFDEAAGRWVVTDRTFDTAAAMHSSNQMMWTFGIVSGFPEVDLATVSDFPAVEVMAEGASYSSGIHETTCRGDSWIAPAWIADTEPRFDSALRHATPRMAWMCAGVVAQQPPTI